MSARRFLLQLLFVVGVAIPGATLLNVDTIHATNTGVQQVSTGDATTCAVVSYKAMCWGSNSDGQLGLGWSGGSTSTPTGVATNNALIPAVTQCQPLFNNPCFTKTTVTPQIDASALAGKTVTKVSVGTTHACAIANAAVYCWGDNGSGELGTRSTDNSYVPVAVDLQQSTQKTIAASCAGWQSPWGCVGTYTPQHTITLPASALYRKEIIDVSAGNYFTCALASDGTVACWGDGANGRLGDNSTDDSTVPVTVRLSAKAIKLARTNTSSMCALAVTDGSTNATTADSYCWGQAMGKTGAIPADTHFNKTQRINKSECTAKYIHTTSDTYFDAKLPVKYSGSVQFSSVDMDAYYATGLGSDNRLYYWGGNGYHTDSLSETTCVKATGGNGLDTGGSLCGGGSNHGAAGCVPKVEMTNTQTVVHSRIGAATVTGPLYDGAVSKTKGGGTILDHQQISIASGNAFNDLFCAVTTTSNGYCDAHETGSASGQTGSNYTPKCTTDGGLFGLFPKRTCDPDPTGPQLLYMTGALSGKPISAMSTGASDYTCAIANGGLYCWGVNSSGQLGDRTTSSRNVPTPVAL